MEETSLAKLVALQTYNQPVSSVKLLRILAPFLYQLSKPATNNSLRIQTIHWLMENWYEKQAKIHDVSDIRTDLYSGYTVCYNCCNILGSDICGLTLSCGECRQEPSLSYYFLADLLAFSYQIPHPVTVKILSDYLGKRYYERLTESN